MQVSLDGFMAGPDGDTNWMIWNWGPQWAWDDTLKKYHTQLTQSADRILISRQMAEQGFIAHWQQTAARGDEQADFANHIVRTPKVVISSTLTKNKPIPGGWDNTDIAGDLTNTVQQLKQQGDGSILVYGGATLVASLIGHQLIDELHLLVNPVAIGKGLSIFKDLQQPLYLQLAGATAFQSGMVVLNYSRQDGE